MDSSLEVLEPDRVRFRCPCGKRYSVPAAHAGRRVRCRSCNRRVKVPGHRVRSGVGRISARTRAVVLAELGLDPAAAEQAYWEGQVESYADQPIPQSPQEDSDELELRGWNEVDSDASTESLRIKIERVGIWKSLGYLAFVWVGLVGFLVTICTLSLGTSLPLAALLAAIGARMVYARA